MQSYRIFSICYALGRMGSAEWIQLLLLVIISWGLSSSRLEPVLRSWLGAMSAFKSVEEAMASLNVQKTAEEVRAEAGVYEIKTTNDIAAPTNLRVVDRTHNTITLKWNASTSLHFISLLFNSFHIASHRTTSHHITSHHIISYHIISYHNIRSH